MFKLIPFILSLILFASCGNKNANNNEPANAIIADSSTLVIKDSIASESTNSFCYGKFEVCIYKITNNEFDSLLPKYNKENKPKKIEDFENAKALIGDCVNWNEDKSYHGALKLKFKNGKEISFDAIDAPLFIAYFPDLDILELEGGHSSQLCYNMTTGCDETEMGNPSDTYLSPNGKLGVSTYFNGQEIDVYFIFTKFGMDYSRICTISPMLVFQELFYIIRAGFWTDNETFYAKTINGNETELNYFKILIKPFVRKEVSDNFIIKKDRAGVFRKGQSVDELKSKFEIRESQIYKEEGNEEPIFILQNEGITFEPKYDYDTDKFTNRIGAIVIRNDKYSTDKLIGTGASISELKKAYPDIKFYYSYIGGDFWAESKALGDIQFQFRERDFINKSINLMSGDSVELSSSDFKSSTMVESVRIY